MDIPTELHTFKIIEKPIKVDIGKSVGHTCENPSLSFPHASSPTQVVISKLRPSDPHHQTQNVNLRAAKALIIIVPLLGITYLVTIVGPSEPDTTLETIFILTRNVLLSFQGFFITLPYCLCSMMRTHWERWRNTKDIGQGPNSARNSIAMTGFNSVCDNLTRKRSRSYSYHVVRGSLVDRRDTQESQMSNMTTITKITKNHSLVPHESHMDGPLVAQLDLVQHGAVTQE